MHRYNSPWIEKKMNSLNILSARVIGQTSHSSSTSRSGSQTEATQALLRTGTRTRKASGEESQKEESCMDGEKITHSVGEAGDLEHKVNGSLGEAINEKTPLLENRSERDGAATKRSRLRLVAKRLVDALTESLKWVLSTLAAPGVYVVTCFYDDHGQFSPIMPVRRISRILPRRRGGSSTAQAVGLSAGSDRSDGKASRTSQSRSDNRPQSLRKTNSISSSSTGTSESEPDRKRKSKSEITSHHTRAKSNTSITTDEIAPARRSIRIKLYSEDTKKKKQKKNQAGSQNKSSDAATRTAEVSVVTAATLKSPTSPTSSLGMSRYPRAPVPPRPLIPRRQPSYTALTPTPSSSRLSQKTLVIDLDETLIHSLAKGGRMSSGHMVEVKLNTPVGIGGTTLGPQHPILYYVHKRPHCDDFLRKVCKWYNLVVFTASVQEYADPVIDWLEQERSFFSGRYYRQHCTFRNGAYIKDLSSVEPDLSRVMILDNSPMSYIFHEGTPSDP